jgi:hypothetical protein
LQFTVSGALPYLESQCTGTAHASFAYEVSERTNLYAGLRDELRCFA